jgi:acetyl esterase/lipase
MPLFPQLNGFEVADAKTYASEQPIRIFSLRKKATGIVFLLIPGGTFMMGFDEQQKQVLRTVRRLLMEDDEQDWEIDINVRLAHLLPML